MECYNHIHLLLQRDVLAPCNCEARAHYNTVKAFFKIVLVESWLKKSLYNELWGTIYRKGWGDPWHSLCDSSTTLMALHLLYDCYIQPLTLDIQLIWLNITMHMYSCETTWLEQALQDITNTRSVEMRPTLWYACDGEGGEMMPSLVINDGVYAPHGEILLKKSLASIATSALIQSLHPTCLLTCAWSSWVWLN